VSSCCAVENENESTVIESGARRKKRGGLDVFQFAETVEPEAWGVRSKDIQVRPGRIYSFSPFHGFSLFQDRISALEREQALKAGAQSIRDDSPLPRLKRPDLSRHYTVVLEDKSPTSNASSL
jgi:hypothetical protein